LLSKQTPRPARRFHIGDTKNSIMHDLPTTLAETFALFPAAWIALIFVVGLLIGSFLNVVIHRVPIMLDREWKAQATEILSGAHTGNEQVHSAEAAASVTTAKYNLLVPRSTCPNCGTMITALHNIPVISWLALRGKCANCRAPISVRYPVVEVITAVLSAAVAWKFGVHWYTAAALSFTWFLIAMSGIDFDTTLLPDNMTLPLMWIGLLLSVMGTVPTFGLPVDMKSSIIGATAGYLSLWSVYHVFKLLAGKEGMGYGDFKLFAALGAWLGWQSLPLIILLSAFTGAVVGITLIVVRGRDRNMPIPFGPYLAAAGWIALMWGDELIGSYLRMSGIGQG
jgi:leader peptidase (prepilin peptidase) / N-methyltransferase